MLFRSGFGGICVKTGEICGISLTSLHTAKQVLFGGMQGEVLWFFVGGGFCRSCFFTTHPFVFYNNSHRNWSLKKKTDQDINMLKKPLL